MSDKLMLTIAFGVAVGIFIFMFLSGIAQMFWLFLTCVWEELRATSRSPRVTRKPAPKPERPSWDMSEQVFGDHVDHDAA